MLNELVRWNPFDEELSSWHRDIDDLFGRFFGRSELRGIGGVPPMETYRKDGNYVVRVDLPGIDPKDLDVHVEGDLLTIKAERKAEEKGPEYRETYYGKFERTVTLPHEICAKGSRITDLSRRSSSASVRLASRTNRTASRRLDRASSRLAPWAFAPGNSSTNPIYPSGTC